MTSITAFEGLFIEDAPGLHMQWIPLTGMVTVYGANGGGKTTVLTAVERSLRSFAAGEHSSATTQETVWAVFDAPDIAEQLRGHLLSDQYIRELAPRAFPEHHASAAVLNALATTTHIAMRITSTGAVLAFAVDLDKAAVPAGDPSDFALRSVSHPWPEDVTEWLTAAAAARPSSVVAVPGIQVQATPEQQSRLRARVPQAVRIDAEPAAVSKLLTRVVALETSTPPGPALGAETVDGRADQVENTPLSRRLAEALPPFIDGRAILRRGTSDAGGVVAEVRLSRSSDVGLRNAGTPLELLSSGERRWVCAAAARALTEVVSPRIGDHSDPSSTPWLDVIWLMDEPEAHLHPRAIDAAAQWLSGLASRSTGMLLATHSPAMLTSQRNWFDGGLTRDAAAPTVLWSQHDFDEAFDQVREDEFVSTGIRSHSVSRVTSGLTTFLAKSSSGAGTLDVLAAHHTVLVVEGRLDERLLRHWFDLEDVYVLVVDGQSNARGVPDLKLLNDFGRPVAVLLDSTRPETVSSINNNRAVPSRLTEEEKTLVRLMDIEREKFAAQTAEDKRWPAALLNFGRPPKLVLALPYPDMLCAVDEDDVRELLGREELLRDGGWDRVDRQWWADQAFVEEGRSVKTWLEAESRVPPGLLGHRIRQRLEAFEEGREPRLRPPREQLRYEMRRLLERTPSEGQ